MNPLVKAEVAKIAADAEVMRIKVEQNKYWERELESALSRIAASAKSVLAMVRRDGDR